LPNKSAALSRACLKLLAFFKDLLKLLNLLRMGSCLTLDRRGESAGTGVRVRAGPTGELGGVAVTRGRVRMVGGGAGGARL